MSSAPADQCYVLPFLLFFFRCKKKNDAFGHCKLWVQGAELRSSIWQPVRKNIFVDVPGAGSTQAD